MIDKQTWANTEKLIVTMFIKVRKYRQEGKSLYYIKLFHFLSFTFINIIILVSFLLDPNPNFAAYWNANQYKNLDIKPMKEVYESYKVTVTK